MTELGVYVPLTAMDEGTLRIKPGSAIVSDGEVHYSDKRMRVDFEGNVHHFDNLNTMPERLLHAAERHLGGDGRGSPTTARLWPRANQMLRVGTYHYPEGTLEIDQRHQAMWDAWCARGGVA